jgi:hypothetical protein
MRVLFSYLIAMRPSSYCKLTVWVPVHKTYKGLLRILEDMA